MLVRTCNSFVTKEFARGILNKRNAHLVHNGNYMRLKLKPNNVRSFYLTSRAHDEDPCKAQDVYKVSPLCPPKGFEYKKKSMSLKCPPKRPCPPTKKIEDKPKEELSKDKKEDSKKDEGKKEAKDNKICDSKEAVKQESSKKEQKKEPPKEGKKEASKEEKKEASKEEKKEPLKDKKEGSPTKEEKECEKKELKGCDTPDGPPTCGKPPDECSTEVRKPVKPESTPKPAKTRPDVELKCPPKKKVNDTCTKKKQCCEKPPPEERCCSTRPWPFNLLQKRCDKPPKKPCLEKSKCKKKMVAIPEKNPTTPLNGSLNYPILIQERTNQFHSSAANQARPICPPVECPICSGSIELSKETEEQMVNLRAVARANRKRLPESCVVDDGPKPCLVPADGGWKRSQNFILVRDAEKIKNIPFKKKYESPRLVTRKLRKRN